MKPSFAIFPAAALMIIGTAGTAWAQGVPEKMPLGRYATLWTKSPFTVPPIVEGPEEVPSVLEDYTLAGVSAVDGGYSVALINKKQREERVHLMPGMKNNLGFTVVSVRQDPIESKNTTVEIRVEGGKTGRIGYDDKFLALKAAPGAKPPAGGRPPVPGQPGAPVQPQNPTPDAANAAAAQQVPGLNPQGGTTPSPPAGTGNQPRVRRVPTPPAR